MELEPLLHFDGVITQVVVYVATAVLAWLVGKVTAAGKADKQEREALYDGVRALLRSELMRTHHQAMRDGFASTTDKEVMQRTYDAYHRLNGNGIATSLYREMMELPTREHDR